MDNMKAPLQLLYFGVKNQSNSITLEYSSEV